MQGMHKQFILTRYSKKSEVLIFTPDPPCMQIIVMCSGSVLCAIRFPFLRMDVVNAFTGLACQKTTGTEQLNCIYIHTKINIQRKHYLLMLFEYVQGRASWGMKAAGESASNFFQLTLRGDKWSVWAAIQRDGGGGLADMDTMNGWGLIWDVEDVENGGCVEDIKVIINHLGLLTNDDMSWCKAQTRTLDFLGGEESMVSP